MIKKIAIGANEKGKFYVQTCCEENHTGQCCDCRSLGDNLSFNEVIEIADKNSKELNVEVDIWYTLTDLKNVIWDIKKEIEDKTNTTLSLDLSKLYQCLVYEPNTLSLILLNIYQEMKNQLLESDQKVLDYITNCIEQIKINLKNETLKVIEDILEKEFPNLAIKPEYILEKIEIYDRKLVNNLYVSIYQEIILELNNSLSIAKSKLTVENYILNKEIMNNISY